MGAARASAGPGRREAGLRELRGQALGSGRGSAPRGIPQLRPTASPSPASENCSDDADMQVSPGAGEASLFLTLLPEEAGVCFVGWERH